MKSCNDFIPKIGNIKKNIFVVAKLIELVESMLDMSKIPEKSVTDFDDSFNTCFLYIICSSYHYKISQKIKVFSCTFFVRINIGKTFILNFYKILEKFQARF